MGTPDFAVPSLEILLENNYEVVGVVTATDKYGGRGGKQLLESAVKKAALRHGIPVLQPRNLKAPEFIESLRALKADLQIIVAFRMLPEVVWNMPPLGTFNLHGSLLPRYRGAAPLNWAVMNGDEETGVTTFFLQHEIDTGDMLLQSSTPIGPEETAGQVHDRLMQVGANLVLATVRLIETGDYRPQKQEDELATPAPKLFRENCEIDFGQTVDQVHNFIRGLSPYPTAWTELAGKTLKIILADKVAMPDHGYAPGTLLTDNRKELKIACRDGFIFPRKLQLAGRKRMDVASFLNGTELESGVVLGRIYKD
ncbi:methionyl-tRNA formyltransferase [Lewinellaceae bacterium SD302]|nr:methionyl-tRNA formyltransferase [Lewinellaceae bacterium SD302]